MNVCGPQVMEEIIEVVQFIDVAVPPVMEESSKWSGGFRFSDPAHSAVRVHRGAHRRCSSRPWSEGRP